ncbi:hypothetical protein AN958_02416 [Leucoagaricus sp. SymC.cos]|nr:hypothetical protein AN958_02416 [Leucoagaricus sp. SymC.cos]
MAAVANPTSTGISSPSDSLIITSPTLSASSLSSSGFDFVAVQQRSLDSEQHGNANADSAHTPVHAAYHPHAGGEPSFSDDDEIVWGVSESEDLEGSTSGLGAVLSDDDFVVLSRTRPLSTSRTRSRTSESVSFHKAGSAIEQAEVMNDKDMIASELATELAKLNVNDSLVGEASGTKMPVDSEAASPEPSMPGALPKKSKKVKERTPEEEEALKEQRRNERKEKKEKEKQEKEAAKPSSALDAAIRKEEETPVPTVAPLPSPSTESTKLPTPNSPKKKKKGKKGKTVATPPSLQPSTEKVSEQASGDKSAPTPYDEAVSFITSYISNTSAHHDQICHLTLLQSLIIELQLIKDISQLPRSIKTAKKFIKPRVFLNVKEYLKKRQEGPEVVKSLMYPSRSALVRHMRQKKNYAPLQWIKRHGLQDLLVGVFRH